MEALQRNLLQCYHTSAVTFRRWFIYVASAAFVAVSLVPATVAEQGQNPPDQSLDQKFQMASAEFDSGHFAEAALHLEGLLREVPESFEVHELLGLVYAAQSQDAKANEQLQEAVHLNPESAAARTNLAASFVRLGKNGQAEAEFKKAIQLEPHSFDANHNLGEFYVQSGKLVEAARFLEGAQKVKPGSYDNGYDLALAYVEIDKPSEAKDVVQGLLKRKETAELHNLLGQIEEKSGDFVGAATEFETAAHMEPSESNLFDWGSELLIHRTLEPAVDVFRRAAERYPKSPRVAIGLGMALYSRGNYDEAVQSLLKAADLNPSDPRCYLFLSKAYDSSPAQANEVIQRFRRFSELRPSDARSFYYYAMSLWKGRRAQDPSLDLHQIESLLRKAISLDPKLAEAHLQLGNLYSDQAQYAEAVPEYVKALENNSELGDAHYRLGQAYVHTGAKDKAQEHFDVYQRLRAQHLADLDKQKAEIRQFVYSEKEREPAKP
jgi:tetratricopeptide (TPR) repeat protein